MSEFGENLWLPSGKSSSARQIGGLKRKKVEKFKLFTNILENHAELSADPCCLLPCGDMSYLNLLIGVAVLSLISDQA